MPALRAVRSLSKDVSQADWEEPSSTRGVSGLHRAQPYCTREDKKRGGSCPTLKGIDCLKDTWDPGPRLGAVTFSKTRSLFVDLCSSLVPGVLRGLVDLGSSDCFLDSKFVISNKLRTREIDPFPLTLIDGTVNCYVNQVVSLPIQLSCGLSCVIECYVTPLDGSCEVVLGHNWLRD